MVLPSGATAACGRGVAVVGSAGSAPAIVCGADQVAPSGERDTIRDPGPWRGQGGLEQGGGSSTNTATRVPSPSIRSRPPACTWPDVAHGIFEISFEVSQDSKPSVLLATYWFAPS